MSLTKINHPFHAQITEKKVAMSIANALHKTHQDESSTAKRIGRKTGMPLATIQKWLMANNAPKTLHLLLLMHHYEEVLYAVCELVGRSINHLSRSDNMQSPSVDRETSNQQEDNSVYRVKYVPINLMIDSHKASQLNVRQLWFMSELSCGKNIKADHIQQQWRVSIKTAKRDIADLQKLGLIQFVGAKKNGRYVTVL